MITQTLFWAAVGVAGAGAVAAFFPPITFAEGQLWGAAGGWLLLSIVTSGIWISVSLFVRERVNWLLAALLGVLLFVQVRDLIGVLRDRIFERVVREAPSGSVLIGSVEWRTADDGSEEVVIAAADSSDQTAETVWRDRALVVRVRAPAEGQTITNFGDESSAAFFMTARLGGSALRIGALNLGVARDDQIFAKNRLTARRLATQMRQGDDPALLVGRISTTASAFECRIFSELPEFIYFSGRGLLSRIARLPVGRCLAEKTLMSRGVRVVFAPRAPGRGTIYAAKVIRVPGE